MNAPNDDRAQSANARLIAAAPEMYKELSTLHPGHTYADGIVRDPNTCRICALLAKIEGR